MGVLIGTTTLKNWYYPLSISHLGDGNVLWSFHKNVILFLKSNIKDGGGEKHITKDKQ